MLCVTVMWGSGMLAKLVSLYYHSSRKWETSVQHSLTLHLNMHALTLGIGIFLVFVSIPLSLIKYTIFFKAMKFLPEKGRNTKN